jgi:phospholipase C
MRCVGNIGFKFGFAIAAIALSACAGSVLSGAQPQAPNPEAARGLLRFQSGSISKIQHVVIVIQENRSFDNLFQGFPGANTQSYGYVSSGKKITLGQIPLETTWDLGHSSAAFFAACNGTGSYPGTDCRMNGFNNEYVGCGHGNYPACPIEYPPYAYVPPAETKPYFAMAEQYVLGDEMFASDFDESSFVAHQYLIAAQSSSAVNFPNSLDWGCYGPPGDTIQTLTQQREIDYSKRISVCFNNTTLGDELDAAGLSWRSYTTTAQKGSGHLWNAYSAIKHIYDGPDWTKDVISPQTVFFTDVQNGNLPVVSWITPTCQNSDHASCGGNTGPDWVASIVNAIGQSQYWDSTAIFVTWDDPGGWYDHVPPTMLDYDGLGFRVPLLVISAYAKQDYVSHVHYELASILRFIEERFGLKSLSASDARATSPAADCFDFKQTPLKFKVIQATRRKDYFMHQPLDLRPPDSE